MNSKGETPQKQEQLICKFKLPMISNLEMVNVIVSLGYRKTFQKFEVTFWGSKGYLNHISISCEGRQKPGENIIELFGLLTTRNQLKKKMVHIFHSAANGVRIEIGGSAEPRKRVKDWEPYVPSKEDEDLPF